MQKQKLFVLGQKLTEKLKASYLQKSAKTKALLRRTKELEEKVDSYEQTKKLLSDL